jgi:hypothetical protein
MPEDGDAVAADGSHAEQPLTAISRGDSPASSVGENASACSLDPAGSCQLGAEGDRVQIGAQKISLAELNGLWRAGAPVTLLDVRTERSIEGSDVQAKGAVRMPPDHVAERARELGLKQEAWLIAYCA